MLLTLTVAYGRIITDATMGWRVPDEWLKWVDNTWIMKKVFADATKIISRWIEKWKKNKSYLLLYTIHRSIYAHIYLCNYPCMLFIAWVQWFCFRGCWLSTECVVAHSLHFLPLFPPSVKILAIIRMAASLCLFTRLYQVYLSVLEIVSPQVLYYVIIWPYVT